MSLESEGKERKPRSMRDENPFAAPSADTKPVAAAKPDSNHAACPSCGEVGAQPVRFTWWGGGLGPHLFSHVKCSSCGATYNGKTGKSNVVAIAIYIVVSFIISIAVVMLMFTF